MISVEATQLGAQFEAILDRVERYKETVVICRDGKPFAQIAPCRPVPNPLQPHPHLSQVMVHEDPSLPLTDEELPEEYR